MPWYWFKFDWDILERPILNVTVISSFDNIRDALDNFPILKNNITRYTLDYNERVAASNGHWLQIYKYGAKESMYAILSFGSNEFQASQKLWNSLDEWSIDCPVCDIEEKLYQD